jgi:hypothetical protein
VCAVVIWCALVVHGLSVVRGQSTPAPAPRAIALADIVAWKTIGMSAVSNDGVWFAYRIGPGEGDAEVVVRQTRGEKEFKFAAGESGGNDVAFSEDSKCVAFSVSPTKKENEALKRQRKPAQNKVTILDLASGKDTTIEKVRRFAFSGEAAQFIALHKYGPDGGTAAPSAGPAPAGPPAAAGRVDQASDRPGSD